MFWLDSLAVRSLVKATTALARLKGSARRHDVMLRVCEHHRSQIGLDAHPHMLRHTLASAMAANKEPASIIAAQLRHADGGALAQRVYIHQLPQTAPRWPG